MRVNPINKRWTVLTLVVLGILISYVDRGNLSIAAPALMHDFALSPESMGLLLSAFFWTYGAFQFPAGWIIDRLGVRRSYLIAFFLWSISSAAIALSRNAHDIFVLRLLLGAAESVGPLASLTFIRHAFTEEERGLPVAAYIAGQTVGPALGALLGTALLSAAGWRSLFAVTGLIAMLWLPFWFFLARGSERRVEPQAEVKVQRWNWPGMLSCPSFWGMSMCVFLFSYYWYFVLTWIPTYLTVSRGLSILSMGRLLSASLFVMAPTNMLVGWLADRAIRRSRNALAVRITIAAAGFMGASVIILLLYASGQLSVFAILAVSVCSFGAASASFWVLVQHLAPVPLTARAIAYFNTISQAAGALAPIVTGHTLGASKDFTLAVWLAGLSALAASLLLSAVGAGGLRRLLALSFPD